MATTTLYPYGRFAPRRRPIARAARAIGAAIAALGAASAAQAFQFDTGDPDYSLTWNNTFKYTAAWRLQDASSRIATSFAQPNVDYGDKALDKGLINNRVDLLSELDFIAYKKAGFRISGAGWYDSVYDRARNDFSGSPIPNDQAALAGGANNRNSDGLKNVMGRRAEVLDAFAFGSFDLGDNKLTLRGGKHTLLFGETLFLGANGVAAAQGPIDLVKAFSLPNAQFKEIAMPVGQVSANLSLSSGITIAAY